MNLLRTYLAQIRFTLESMSVQSRIAAISLAFMVVFALAWMISSASRPNMVKVYRNPFDSEMIADSEQLLKNRGIEVEVEGLFLKVPAGKQDMAQAILAEKEMAPLVTSESFEELALTNSMWTTEAEGRRKWEYATQKKLSALISDFTDVKSANVVIQQGQAKGLGTRHIPGSVSVHLTMQRGRGTTVAMRRAIADMVIPAVPGLKRSDVRIIDASNNQSFTMSDDGDSGDEKLENLARWERHYRDNLASSLSYIPGVVLGVYVETDPTKNLRTEQRQYGDPVTAKISSNSEAMEGAAGSAVEPGVRANTNTGVAIPTTGVSKGSSHESTETRMDVRFSETLTIRDEGSRGLNKISVSVGVPYSYLVSSFKALSGDEEATPTDQDIDTQLATIRDHVRNVIGVEEQSLVNVSWFVDGMTLAGGSETVEAGVTTLIAANGKNIALGTLAVFSLFMVLMFARRRVPDPPIIDQPLEPEDMLDTALDAMNGGDGALEGVELDEEAIRSQKIVDQVRDMVNERPESAANLIRRWIEQG